MPSPGSWVFSSKTDPRWNCDGETEYLSVTGGMPDEARKKLDELTEKYGAAPLDLYYECMKD